MAGLTLCDSGDVSQNCLCDCLICCTFTTLNFMKILTDPRTRPHIFNSYYYQLILLGSATCKRKFSPYKIKFFRY